MAKKTPMKGKVVNVALVSTTNAREYEVLIVRAEGMVAKFTLTVPQGGTLRLREKAPGVA